MPSGQGLRYAIRALLKHRATTSLALLALTLGIGASATLFSLIDTLYLRPLPVPHAGRIVHVYERRSNGEPGQMSLPDYLYYRDHSPAFEELAAHYPSSPMHVVVGNDPVAVTGSVVTASYFSVLGIAPHHGRFFTADEDAVPDRDAVAVVSYGFWTNTLGADPQALGRTIDVNGRAFTIVGIAPREFNGVVRGASVSQVWIPSAMFAVGYRYCDAFDPECTIVDLIGRLKPSVSREEAEAGLAVLARQLDATYPSRNANRHRGVAVLQANGAYPAVRTNNGPIVRLLLGGVGLLVLIACANVAGLMLAGGLARRKEMAVKMALGASRWRVMRQVLAECVLLAISGSVLGLTLAVWAVDLVSAFYGADYAGRPVNLAVSIGAWPLVATAVLCGLTAILCGIAPALQAGRTDVLPVLKLEGISGRRTRTPSRDVLVACQIAMSTVLLIGAGLLVRSTIDLMRGPGIDPEHVALLRLRPSLVGYDAQRARAFQRAVIERLTSVPGVERAATSENLPVFFSGNDVAIRSESAAGRVELGAVRASRVGNGYFDVMGLRLLGGRDFNSSDRVGTRRVAIADATLASALGGSDIVGRIVSVDGEEHEIIGIVPSAQFRNALEPPAPYLYLNYWQQDGKGFAADSRTHVRVTGDPSAILPRLRREIAAIDRYVPVSEDYPLSDRVRFHFQPVRMAMTMLVFFGAAALTLSVIGIYGVLSSVATMRAREVAVRMALGARRQQIGWLMADHGLRLVVPGVIIGVLVALLSSAVLRSLLYGVAHHDIVTFVAIPVALVLMALAAMSVPIRRTMLVDPAVTLRGE